MANFEALTCESVCAYLKENIPNLSDGVVEKVRFPASSRRPEPETPRRQSYAL